MSSAAFSSTILFQTFETQRVPRGGDKETTCKTTQRIRFGPGCYQSLLGGRAVEVEASLSARDILQLPVNPPPHISSFICGTLPLPPVSIPPIVFLSLPSPVYQLAQPGQRPAGAQQLLLWLRSSLQRAWRASPPPLR